MNIIVPRSITLLEMDDCLWENGKTVTGVLEWAGRHRGGEYVPRSATLEPGSWVGRVRRRICGGRTDRHTGHFSLTPKAHYYSVSTLPQLCH